tara:strand:- start:815 stop:1006 length:192 start_codon:yes stop_codon:yes gene_type:complete
MVWHEEEEGAWMLNKVINKLEKGKVKAAIKWVNRIVEDFEVSKDEVWEAAGEEVERNEAVSDH